MDNQDFIDKITKRYMDTHGYDLPKNMNFVDGKPSQLWLKPSSELAPFMIFTQKGMSPIVDSDFWNRITTFFNNFFGKTDKKLILQSLIKYVRENGENYSEQEFDTIYGPYIKNYVSTSKLRDWWNDDLFKIVD